MKKRFAGAAESGEVVKAYRFCITNREEKYMSKKIKDEDIDENVYLGLRAAPRPQAAMTRPKGPAQQIINTPTAQQNQSVSQAVNVSVSPVTEGESDFDGGVLDYIGMNFASLFLFIITLTLGLAWVICYRKRWHIHHTIVQGRRLKFTGKGIQLFGNIIKWDFSPSSPSGSMVSGCPSKSKNGMQNTWNLIPRYNRAHPFFIGIPYARRRRTGFLPIYCRVSICFIQKQLSYPLSDFSRRRGEKGEA